MGLFGFLRRDNSSERPFLGCWRAVRVDGTSLSGDLVELEFRPGGVLLSSVRHGTTWDVTRDAFRVEESTLLLGNKRVGFVFERGGDVLRIDSFDNSVWYQRSAREAPER
jgi:hypothetical protein